MSRMVKTLVLASFLAIVACSSGGGGGPSTSGNGSCVATSGGMVITCTDFGAGFNANNVMQLCSTSMGTFSTGSCPSANRVGRCEVTETRGSVTAGDAVSIYAPASAAQAMMVCNSENGVNGVTTTWVPN
jgi:hypothetical protein